MEYSAAKPVFEELPVYDHDDDRPVEERLKDDRLENPVMDMPFQRTSPWPNLALKSPAMILNGLRIGVHSTLPENVPEYPSDVVMPPVLHRALMP